MSKLTTEEEAAILKALEAFDTPTVTNVVATYPGKETCLSLYDPWTTDWYTDDSLRVMYPELGPRCGYAVTCTYGLPDPSFKGGPGMGDILRAIAESPKPVVLLIKQDYPERIKHKNGLCGGNMSTAFKSAGCNAIISDGPSRDVNEVRPMGIQYMLTGTSAGHGPMQVKAVNTPVSICGMDVAPGEIVHLDENGAVKFPRKYLKEVLDNCRELEKEETKKMAMLASTSDPEKLAQYMKGVYDWTAGIFDALAQAIVSVIPASLNNVVHIILGLLVAPFSVLLNTDAIIYGIMPVAVNISEQFGVSPTTVAAMFCVGTVMTKGICLTNASVYLGLGMMRIEWKEAFKRCFGWAVLVASIMVLLTAVFVRW